MKKIDYLNLQMLHSQIENELIQKATKVIKSGNYVSGEQVSLFEEKFAEMNGSKFAICTNSGTSALQLSILALGIKPGDEVITTNMTFVATVAAILYCQAIPVLVDINKIDKNIELDFISRAINNKTKLIIPVHLHGRMSKIEQIISIANEQKIKVIEDSAQAHFASLGNKFSGTFGSAGIFSFYPGKNLGALGEGGIVVTDDEEVASEIRILRNWGARERYNHLKLGFNYRMDEIQAAFLNVKLDYIKEWNAARRKLALYYDHILTDLEMNGYIVKPSMPNDLNTHVWHIYAIEVENRDDVAKFLKENGIGTNSHYPNSINQNAGYIDRVKNFNNLPNSEEMARKTLSLPLYPGLTESDLDYIKKILTLFFKRFNI